MVPPAVENRMVNYEAVILWAVEMTIIKVSMEAIK
jgi:hypothetical protein